MVTESNTVDCSWAATMRVIMIHEADKHHAKYPQYKNHWDNWVLGRVNKTVSTKLGVAFKQGDIALVKPGGEFHEDAKGKKREYVIAYSFRNKCDTMVRADKVSYEM